MEVIELARKGYFEIHENGDIYRLIDLSTGKKIHKRIPAHITRDGYHVIRFNYQRKIYAASLHRIIYSFFRGRIPEKHIINHIDGDRSNNTLSNLEEVTPKENVHHAIYHTKNMKVYGECSPRSRLSKQDAVEIYFYKNRGMYTAKQLAEKYNISVSQVYYIARGKAWPHLFNREHIARILTSQYKEGEPLDMSKLSGKIFIIGAVHLGRSEIRKYEPK
jgi:hypothetical protein